MPSATIHPDVLAAITAIKTSNTLLAAKAALTSAKKTLLKERLLTPPVVPGDATSEMEPAKALRLQKVAAIREVYELGALVAIRARDPLGFERYVFQAKMCYEAAPRWILAEEAEQQRRVIGLYLLLLLSKSDYATFNSEMEPLLNSQGVKDGQAIGSVEMAALLSQDPYLGYPIQLERWLTEGRYDMMWKALQSERVPCEEYSHFTEILEGLIRSEIATSSESAYDSMSIQSAKSLLFMDSEGSVIRFARNRGWTIRDGCIVFPTAKEIAAAAVVAEQEENPEKEVDEELAQKQFVGKDFIAGVQGYAKVLESIV